VIQREGELMASGINLGRIFGINIHLDWSWVFIFVLVTWNLAASVFPGMHPDWSPGLNWALGIIAAILFFASVLAHELAHSLVAVSHGLPVRRITMFLFGGVSNITKEPTSPGVEFIMAIVGPLTSIALGGLFLAIGLLSGGINLLAALRNPVLTASHLSPIATMLFWLGPINIILGLFNLIPGFPLDGGRVLRSILWGISQNLRLATRWASWIGQFVAWIFIITGIAMVFGLSLPLFGTGFVSGLWMAFIGWFLNNAAVQSYQQVVIQDVLEGIPVSRLMQREPVAVHPDMSISQLVDGYIMQSDERSFPVMNDTQLVGLVSLEDIRKIPRSNWDTTQVSQIMTPSDKIEVVTPREDATQALDALNRRDVRQLPVIQDGHLVGMIRRRDILRWLQLQSEVHPGGMQPKI
jgi:Zn-dependent protease/CBS domain-containing protein